MYKISPASYLILAIIACCMLLSCAAVGPVLSNAAIKFGQDVLASSARNISPQYASDLEQLFLALVKQQTGLSLTPKLGDQYGEPGQESQGYEYAGVTQEPYGYDQGGQQDQYGYSMGTPQDAYGYAGSSQQESYRYVDNTQQDSYGYGSNAQGYYGYGESKQQDIPGYGSNTRDTYGNVGGARQDSYGYNRNAQAPISMDVGLLAQRIQADGRVGLDAIQDGAVLYDGRGDARAGDKLKITFKTNCECYVYIIGIDATGYVAQIFPDPDSMTGNPAQRDRQYTLPEGDVWWGLDEYRGIETVYFVASQTRRLDIEDAIAKMASIKRRIPKDYQPVQVAAVIPHTRGLVKVKAAPATTVTTESGTAYAVTPTAFSSVVSGVDLVITRWFSHQ